MPCLEDLIPKKHAKHSLCSFPTHPSQSNSLPWHSSAHVQACHTTPPNSFQYCTFQLVPKIPCVSVLKRVSVNSVPDARASRGTPAPLHLPHAAIHTWTGPRATAQCEGSQEHEAVVHRRGQGTPRRETCILGALSSNQAGGPGPTHCAEDASKQCALLQESPPTDNFPTSKFSCPCPSPADNSLRLPNASTPA